MLGQFACAPPDWCNGLPLPAVLAVYTLAAAAGGLEDALMLHASVSELVAPWGSGEYSQLPLKAPSSLTLPATSTQVVHHGLSKLWESALSVDK